MELGDQAMPTTRSQKLGPTAFLSTRSWRLGPTIYPPVTDSYHHVPETGFYPPDPGDHQVPGPTHQVLETGSYSPLGGSDNRSLFTLVEEVLERTHDY